MGAGNKKMASLDWSKFNILPGDKAINFENLCRAVIRLHFGQYGQFEALKNQPGVEFHLNITHDCDTLGKIGRWYGWQCKFFTLTAAGKLRSSSKNKIKESIRKTLEHVPGITDWVLWLPYTLCKDDYNWYKSLKKELGIEFKLHLWAKEDIETHLVGPGLLLKESYFGDLILTPEELHIRHTEAVQPIKSRWMKGIHQEVDAERYLRRVLLEPVAWDSMISVGESLKKSASIFLQKENHTSIKLKDTLVPFAEACLKVSNMLLNFHVELEDVDFESIIQKFNEHNLLITIDIHAVPRKLRTWNHPLSLIATNALNDLRYAKRLFDEIKDKVQIGVLAVLAEAGGGKTQIAAQLTSKQSKRPAGILLHGRDLHKGENLDNLSRKYLINGKPVNSFESLIASLDSAGKRASCRLPIVIDGLNEAENPKDWKAPLASLQETMKRYQNVVVVCTLRTGEHKREIGIDRVTESSWDDVNPRECFAVMSLPEDIEILEIEGFGKDELEAIKKYFHYYKIDSADMALPFDFFQHPLNLRIFCEISNPDRKSTFKVDYFPASLTPLFDEFIDNMCKRISEMPNLGNSYNYSDLKLYIYYLGIQLWESGSRDINESNFRDIAQDNNRPWRSQIVNLLVQEGLIFRNPGVEPGIYELSPVYDALGGFIIANSILLKYKSSSNFDWLNEKSFLDNITGHESHQLSQDIFRSLVAQFPRKMGGVQLWKVINSDLKEMALVLATEVENQYIDQETVDEFMKMFCNASIKKQHKLFSRLRITRGSIKHKFNSSFLDMYLRTMSVSRRDLSWTEWVRKSREAIIHDLSMFEERWKDNISQRSETDKLLLTWVIWLLTSTDTRLRDLATRTIYQFGLGDPEALFNATLDSLSINDPYVSERMLASSYGASMSIHFSVADTYRPTLIKYCEGLIKSMLSPEAEFPTSHTLSLDFALNTIKRIVYLCQVELRKDDKELLKSPYKVSKSPFKRMEDVKEEEILQVSSAVRGNFRNYTIGGLIPDRANYDFGNPEFIKAEKLIKQRIYELGYRDQLFSDAELSIGRFSERYSYNQTEKVERYSKKYAKIAYFEMNTVLQCSCPLSERLAKVDIDPSFPENPKPYMPKLNNLFKDTSEDKVKWINSGPTPNYHDLLELDGIEAYKHKFILLNGYIQEKSWDGREIFTFLRGVLVNNKCSKFEEKFLECEYPGNSNIPNNLEEYYTFGGEIPWSDNFGKELRNSDGQVQKDIREAFSEYDAKSNKFIGIPIELPSINFTWESYHSLINQAGLASVPSPSICDEFNLSVVPRQFDMVDASNKLASIYRRYEDDLHSVNLLYIRKDLIDTYLQKNNISLVWAMWGERNINYKLNLKVSLNSPYQNIHKSFLKYS